MNLTKIEKIQLQRRARGVIIIKIRTIIFISNNKNKA